MRIVVIGAGAVGSHLAERLSLEHQDVVVIEANPVTAMEVQEQIDCLVINGNGASQETLEQAGVAKADLFIAVTSSDAVNVLVRTRRSQDRQCSAHRPRGGPPVAGRSSRTRR